MKFKYIISVILAFSALVSCKREEAVEFAIEGDDIQADEYGGVYNINVSSPGNWVASASEPWLTVSPANGRGSQLCQIIVDSSVVFSNAEAVRNGVVRIETDDDRREITVTQKNFPYQISVEEPEVSIPNFEDRDKRWFDVVVNANSDFRVKPEYDIDEAAGITGNWLEVQKDELELDRGARPRKVKIRFNWDINSATADRTAAVKFIPVDEEGKDIADASSYIIDPLSIVQTAADPMPEDPRMADSTALVGIAQALGIWSMWDTTIPMDRWEGVELWDSDDDALHGRVKSAYFYMYSTDDYIPFQVQYLTAAEELTFYSNENSFAINKIEIGPYLLKLGETGRLKRLTISAHGLEDIPEEFAVLGGKGKETGLEYLDLSSNNLKKIPDVITEENFPHLHALLLNTNQRRLVYDTKNVSVTEDKFSGYYGGLYDEISNQDNWIGGDNTRSFPKRFLLWENLDTLSLSVNYLQGTIPSDEEVKALGIPVYSQADFDAQEKDTLAQYLLDQQVAKVLPKMRSLSLNLNRFTGKLPDWLLYHPNLDFWDPLVLVFNQEGRDRQGNSAGFTNAPENLEYYYDAYPNKYYAPKAEDEEN